MKNKDFAFGKINFIMIGVSMLIVVAGFVMMTGASSDAATFNRDIFSASRISIAPMVCLFGFVSIIAGIMYQPKKKEGEDAEKLNGTEE